MQYICIIYLLLQIPLTQTRSTIHLSTPFLPRPSLSLFTTPFYPDKNGCSSASLGVIRLAGSRCKHFSNRSTKLSKSLISSSFIFIWTLEGGSSRERRSREAEVMTSVFKTSCLISSPLHSLQRQTSINTRNFGMAKKCMPKTASTCQRWLNEKGNIDVPLL